VPNVRIDNVAAATVHLVQLGHRSIAIVTGPPGNPVVKDRVRGYRQQMQRAGLPLLAEHQVIGDFSLESGYRGMRQLLALSRKPTAVFRANDEMAMGAIRAVEESGRRVPEGISIVGFDDLGFAEYVDPPLTTVRQPRHEIGETAMRLMFEVIAGRGGAKTLVLPHQLVVRDSTRA
jgi:LacI family repressor for deo operon, udp, cdd, tsx, nupC, and nupG